MNDGVMGKLNGIKLGRRAALRLGGATIAMAARLPDAFATASDITRSELDFAMPDGACDCHVHIIGDPMTFPMSPDRVYTPPEASVDALLARHRDLNLVRVVCVQPSFYGADNGALLDAMRRLGPHRARGVAVVGDDASGLDLDGMAKAGIRGIRINLETAGELDSVIAAGKLKAAIALCHPLHWHIQLYTRPLVIAALADIAATSPVPLVFDHFAGAQAARGLSQPGFDAVLKLVRSGKAYVKISAAYRATKMPPPYDDIVPFAQALVAANPERVLWGSDWPHTDPTRVPGRAPTDVTPFLPVNDGIVLNQLPRWVPDATLRKTILTDNPARLYGF